MMTTLRRTLLIASLSLAVPAAAAAQGSQSSPAGFAGVLGGLTFGATTSSAIAANGGIGIAPGLFVFGELGYMHDVIPGEFKDVVDDLADMLEFQTGARVALDLAVPQIYAFSGMRWSPSRGRVSPFVEGGVGIGRISLRVDRAEVGGIDMRDDVEDAMGDDVNSTALLFAAGGGVNAAISRSASMDLGFRYMRLAAEDPSAVNVAMVYAAIKFGR